MAELAIPLIGFGLAYVYSNKNDNNKTSKKETFVNAGRHANALPNTSVPNRNFPVSNQPIDLTNQNYVKQFIDPNQTTDRFFDHTTQIDSIKLADGSTDFNSMSGKNLESKDFIHNNMVPFFGSTIKGPQIDRHLDTHLDNRQGAGSQIISKVEQAPLFKPEDHVQWSHGMPNNSDFVQSRQLPSNKVANVLPWEQKQVAPGLGLGFTTEGAGGFNSGMLDREAWQPPTVDQLRTVTNPRITFGLAGHEGPAQSRIQNLPVQGKVEKNRPDTDFAMGPEHWLTTTGSSLGPTQKPEQMMGDVNKCTSEYYGSGGNGADSKSTYVKGHHEETTRQQLCATNLNPVAALGHGASNANDYGIKGYNIPKNNRQVACESKNNGTTGAINGAFKAMVAPVMDALRPSRKENLIYNANQLGNIQSSVPSLPITNPHDRPKITNKEMTADKIGLNYLNVSHLSNPEGGYKNVEIQVKDQQRNDGDSSSRGNVGNTSVCNSQMDVKAWNEQHNNVNKTHENWPMAGGTALFNNNANVQIAKKDADRNNNRLQTNDFIQQPQSSMTARVPSLETYGKINMPQQYDQEMNSNRMNPDILSAFKSNPYAHSLNSY
jgi:hypothetical protein